MQSRDSSRFFQKASRSEARGKHPLTPTMATGSGRCSSSREELRALRPRAHLGWATDRPGASADDLFSIMESGATVLESGGNFSLTCDGYCSNKCFVKACRFECSN